MINKLIFFAAIFVAGNLRLAHAAPDCFSFVEIDYGTANASRVDVVQDLWTNLTLKLSPAASAAGCPDLRLRLKLQTELPERCEIQSDKTIKLLPGGQSAISVKGTFLGYARIHLQASNISSANESDDSAWSTAKEVVVATRRQRRPRDEIFQFIIFALIIFGNAGIGLTINWQDIRDVLKRPIGPAIGFCCQYIIMPLTAFTAVKLISLEPSIALGIFIVGCSPGGGGSNYHTYFLGGNLPLSVTMTILSTIAALAMMPFWIYTLGQLVIQGESMSGTQITIDFFGIASSLASTVFPFTIGILVRWWRPQLAEKMFRYGVRPMLVLIFLYLITIGLLTNWFVFRIIANNPKIILAAVCLPYVGFSLGFCIALLLRQGRAKAITIAVETGIQSAGVAIATLTLSLKQPDADIAIVGPLATTMLTPIPLWIFEIILGIHSICVKKGRCGGSKDDCSSDKESAKEAANSSVSVPLVSPDPSSCPVSPS